MNKGHLNKKAGRLAGMLVIASSALSACGTAQGTGDGIRTDFLLVAIVMLLVLAGGLAWLIRSGRFKKWSSSGLNLNKWRSQEKKLRAQKEKVEQEQVELIQVLGEQAWKARVSHPDYVDHFNVMVGLADHRKRLADESAVLGGELKKANDTRAKITAEYSKQTSDLESLHKDAAKRIEKSQSQQAKLAKDLEKINAERETLRAKIETQQHKLAEVMASDVDDKDARMDSIQKEIKASEMSLAEATARMTEIDSEISRLELEQQPFGDKLTRLTNQVATVEGDQAQALAPLDQRIAELEQRISAKKVEIETLDEQLRPMIDSLGPMVAASRPKSEDLSATYGKLDAVKAKLGEITQEIHLIVARISTCDQNEVRNFYLMLAGIALLVVLSVVFFVLAFG